MSALTRGLRSVLCLLGAHHLARRLNRRRLLICCYHGVREDAAGIDHWLLLPRTELLRQLRYLKRHYRCVSADQAVAELRAGTLSDCTACITFDDGYRNNRTLALEL